MLSFLLRKTANSHSSDFKGFHSSGFLTWEPYRLFLQEALPIMKHFGLLSVQRISRLSRAFFNGKKELENKKKNIIFPEKKSHSLMFSKSSGFD